MAHKEIQIAFSLLTGIALLSLSCARSITLLRGEEVTSILEKEGPFIQPADFTYEELRDRIDGKLILAIFNRDEGAEDAGNFQWIVKDKNIGGKYPSETRNVVLLDTPAGRRGRESFPGILEEIRSSHLLPVVIRDQDQKIRAVVYKPGSLSIKSFVRRKGGLRLELGSRMRNSGNIIYSFEIK